MSLADVKFCPTCGQPQRDEHDEQRHDGEGFKVTVGFTAKELADLLTNMASPTLIVRLIRAIQLIDEPLAAGIAAYYEIAPPPLK